ncbi:MAG: hypothetical protein JRH20_17475 [Deltaproteobacteria bacterium]|nr:hypothetical protein [Deltaproteobacteria bacterium]
MALTLMTLLFGQSANAEETNPASIAKKHNAAAKDFFNLGKFAEAAKEYEKAYQAKNIPGFLYNLAQCHRRIGGLPSLKKAKFYFESFLNNTVDTESRNTVQTEIAEVAREIKRLEGQQKEEDKPKGIDEPGQTRAFDLTPIANTQAGGPNPVEGVSGTKPFYCTWWFWTVVGVVAVGTTATVIAVQPTDISPIAGTLDHVHLN